MDYDYEHLSDESYKLQFTAYAALCQGKAVCQGYAVLFYRICKEAGLPVRIITGIGNGGNHAWNIVKVRIYYYNIDCTWDGQDKETRQNWFLLNETDFENHSRDSEYTSSEFYQNYPMAPLSYKDYIIKFPEALNLENLSAEYTTVEDEKISSIADGKPKILIFFNSGEDESKTTIQDISRKIADFAGADVYAIDTGHSDKDAVVSFQQQYGCEEMLFSYDTGDINSDSMNAYVTEGKVGNPVSLPVICLIDAQNRLQRVMASSVSAEDLLEYLICYCDYSAQKPVVEKYKITYVLNGGENSSENPAEYASETSVTLQDAVREGYQFAGWYRDEACTVKVTEIPAGSTGDITLYAKWEKAQDPAPTPEPDPEPDPTPEPEPVPDAVKDLYSDDKSAYIPGYPVDGYPYTGKAQKPEVIVFDRSGGRLTSKDYTVKYTKNVNVGQAKITIKGKGKKKSEVRATTITFTIRPVELGAGFETLPIKAKVYAAKEQKPSVKVRMKTADGKTKTLKAQKDYMLSYDQNENSGTASVIITGKGNFTGSMTTTFEIKKKPINKGIKVGKITAPTYDGTAKCPRPASVKFGKKVLEEGKDYTLSYQNNTEKGKAQIIITGIGNYEGTLKKNFKII